MPLPSTVYRYRSLNSDGFRFAQDILVRNRLYWPLHSQLNDPAEGLYRDALRLVKQPSGKYFPAHAPLIRPDKDARIISFAESPKHPLMWSHYADAHRGICIGFLRRRFPGVERVRYPLRVPRLDPRRSEDKKWRTAFLTKRAAWNYEKEWRLLDLNTEPVGPRYLELPKGTVTRVIFGEKTPADDREWVFTWLEQSGIRAITQRASFSGAAGRLTIQPFGANDIW
jgi:hypothetical protein